MAATTTMLKAPPTFWAPSAYDGSSSSPRLIGVCLAHSRFRAIRCRISRRGCDYTVRKGKLGHVAFGKFLTFAADGDGVEAQTETQEEEPKTGKFDFEEFELETEEKLWDMYERWRSHFRVSRSMEEKRKRFNAFKANALYVHNANKMDRSYKLGLNNFSDMTNQEFTSSYANNTMLMEHHRNRMLLQGKLRGSFWAFSTVVAAVLSILYRLATTLLKASPTFWAPSAYVRSSPSPSLTSVCLAHSGFQAIWHRISSRGCDYTVPKGKLGHVSFGKFLTFAADGDGVEAPTETAEEEPEAEGFEFEEFELETEEKLWDMYERWRSLFKVLRSMEEKHKRFNVFKANARYVHNANKMDRPYKLKINKFADMTNHEFMSIYANSKLTKHHRMLLGARLTIDGHENVPTNDEEASSS